MKLHRRFAAIALAAVFASAAFLPLPSGAAPAEAPAVQAAAPTASVPNPIKEYEDVPTLQHELGFPVLYLPGELFRSYDPAVSIMSVGGMVGDLRFISQHDDSNLMVRTALRYDSGLDDISGFYGYEWVSTQLDSTEDSKIDICAANQDTFAARWVAGNFAFAIAMSNTDAATFARAARSFHVASQKFAARFARITTAQKPAQ